MVPHTITVMLGGSSEEREVSLRTGVAVARALRSLGHSILELDPDQDNWKLPAETEVVFLALHGTFGEDGTVQRRLEELGVPYTGCGPESSRLAFDKILTKQRCQEEGIPTPRFLELQSADTAWPEGWEVPVVLKPVRQGSSVGLQFVEQARDWPTALSEAFRHDGRVLLEERIVGRETTVGILDGRPLPVVEIRPKKGAYDYQNKYTLGATEYLCPAPLSSETTRVVQQVAMHAFRAIGGRDYARVDIMVDASDQPWVLEVNTLPGMTETSLLPKAAAAAGLSYSDLCQRMIELALQH